MKLELEESGRNVGVLESQVVPGRGDLVRLGFPKLGDLPSGHHLFEVGRVIYVGENCGGSRAFENPAATRIVLDGKVLETVPDK